MQIPAAMSEASHYQLLSQGVVVWVAFWLVGLPDYYQQYSMVWIAMLSILLSVLISLAAIVVLQRTRPEIRMSRALWISFYYTVPLFVLDAIYCGFYLGHGSGYFWKFWYLTIFYFTPWLTFLPTAWLLGSKSDPAP